MLTYKRYMQKQIERLRQKYYRIKANSAEDETEYHKATRKMAEEILRDMEELNKF